MKILLTGGGGMVGKNFLEYTRNQNFEILSPSSKQLNLLDFDKVTEFIGLNRPDVVIHAAGMVGGIQSNIENPVSFLISNAEMGINLIKASKLNGVKYFLNIASSCMYPRDAENPLKEEYILNGQLEPTNEGYALAKILVTRLCEYVNKEHANYHYKTIIPCNLYGKYDKFEPQKSHMLPAVIRKIHLAKINNLPEVEIWGDGHARREFMYAEDLADFINFAVSNIESLPQNINIGLGYDYTINEYYHKVSEVIGFKGDFIHDLTKPTGMRQKVVDISKVSKMGWKPKTSLLEGIRKSYNYYKENINE